MIIYAIGLTNPGIGGVYVLFDDNHDGLADGESVLFADVPSIHGILHNKAEQKLYYTSSGNVFSIPLRPNQRRADLDDSGALLDREHIAKLGTSRRFTHTLAQSANGTLYVSVGRFDTADCRIENNGDGAVLRIGPNEPMQGTKVMLNCRNPMFLNCRENECFAMELSGDSWVQQDGSAEKLMRIDPTRPVDVGYPFCIKKGVPNADCEAKPLFDCNDIDDPVQEFVLTSTPFQFVWDVGQNYPPPARNALIVAMHGSFQTWSGAGLFAVEWDSAAQKPKSSHVWDLLPDAFGRAGWAYEASKGQGQGRLSGVAVHPDGRLFLADDRSGEMWWLAPRSLRKPPDSMSTFPPTPAPPTVATPPPNGSAPLRALFEHNLFLLTLLYFYD